MLLCLSSKSRPKRDEMKSSFPEDRYSYSNSRCNCICMWKYLVSEKISPKRTMKNKFGMKKGDDGRSQKESIFLFVCFFFGRYMAVVQGSVG